MRTHVHDVGYFIPLLGGVIKKVKGYTSRALLAPEAAVVYADENVEPYLNYLNQLGFGPDQMWQVKSRGETLFESIDKSPKKEEILEESDVIIPYSSWHKINKFKEKWGLELSQWGAQPEEIHIALENKIKLRSQFPSELFVDYQVGSNLSEIRQISRDMIDQYGSIVVRHPKMASGVGSKLITEKNQLETEEFTQFVKSHCIKDMLVEQFLNRGKEFSITWEVDRNKEVNLLYWSLQYIENRTHKGNMIEEPEVIFPWEAKDQIKDIQATTYDIVDQYRCPGRVGFDLIAEPDGTWNILECNCRYGGSAYPEFVRRQLDSNRSVIMYHIHPKEDSFQEVHNVFEELGIAYDPDHEKGAFVANPSCLPKKCSAILVEENPQQAEEKLSKIKTYFS